MKAAKQERAIRIACVLALVALGLIVWSLLDPRPVPVILAMSIAQGIGTLSFGTFLWVVALDLRAAQRAANRAERPPP
jgi:peptidoglycan/LPS O-acetylase OafA/YrhL